MRKIFVVAGLAFCTLVFYSVRATPVHIIPQPLQVRRLAIGARAGEQQVARVLYVQCGQGRITTLLELGDAPVSGQLGGSPEIDVHAAKARLVLRQVPLTQRFE